MMKAQTTMQKSKIHINLKIHKELSSREEECLIDFVILVCL